MRPGESLEPPSGGLRCHDCSAQKPSSDLWWCRDCALTLCNKCNLVMKHTEHRTAPWVPEDVLRSCACALEWRCSERSKEAVESEKALQRFVDEVKTHLIHKIHTQLEQENSMDRRKIATLSQTLGSNGKVYQCRSSPAGGPPTFTQNLRDSDVDRMLLEAAKIAPESARRFLVQSNPTSAPPDVLSSKRSFAIFPDDLTAQEFTQILEDQVVLRSRPNSALFSGRNSTHSSHGAIFTTHNHLHPHSQHNNIHVLHNTLQHNNRSLGNASGDFQESDQSGPCFTARERPNVSTSTPLDEGHGERFRFPLEPTVNISNDPLLPPNNNGNDHSQNYRSNPSLDQSAETLPHTPRQLSPTKVNANFDQFDRQPTPYGPPDSRTATLPSRRVGGSNARNRTYSGNYRTPLATPDFHNANQSSGLSINPSNNNPSGDSRPRLGSDDTDFGLNRPFNGRRSSVDAASAGAVIYGNRAPAVNNNNQQRASQEREPSNRVVLGERNRNYHGYQRRTLPPPPPSQITTPRHRAVSQPPFCHNPQQPQQSTDNNANLATDRPDASFRSNSRPNSRSDSRVSKLSVALDSFSLNGTDRISLNGSNAGSPRQSSVSWQKSQSEDPELRTPTPGRGIDEEKERSRSSNSTRLNLLSFHFGSDFLTRPIDLVSLTDWETFAISDSCGGVYITNFSGDIQHRIKTEPASASSLAYCQETQQLFVSLLRKTGRSVAVYDVPGFAPVIEIGCPTDPKIDSTRTRWLATTVKGDLYVCSGDNACSAIWRHEWQTESWIKIKEQTESRYQYLQVTEESTKKEDYIVLMTTEGLSSSILLFVVGGGSKVWSEHNLSVTYHLRDYLRSPASAVCDEKGNLLILDYKDGKLWHLKPVANSRTRAIKNLAALGAQQALGLTVYKGWCFVACLGQKRVHAIHYEDFDAPSVADSEVRRAVSMTSV